MVISRVSSCFSSSFFGSILSQEKEVCILLIISLTKLAHTQLSFTFSSCRKELRIAMSTTVWFLCNDRSLVWSSSLWSLAKFTKTYKKKRPCQTPPWYFIHSWHFKHWTSWNSPGIQYSTLFKRPCKIGQLNWWMYSYLCKRNFWHPGYWKLTWSSVVWETE